MRHNTRTAASDAAESVGAAWSREQRERAEGEWTDYSPLSKGHSAVGARNDSAFYKALLMEGQRRLTLECSPRQSCNDENASFACAVFQIRIVCTQPFVPFARVQKESIERTRGRSTRIVHR